MSKNNIKQNSEKEEENPHSSRERLISSFMQDLPILMHGSGDVSPEQINPSTSNILAELTANYVRDLVHAAIDAHDIYSGHNVHILPENYDRSPDHSSNRKRGNTNVEESTSIQKETTAAKRTKVDSPTKSNVTNESCWGTNNDLFLGNNNNNKKNTSPKPENSSMNDNKHQDWTGGLIGADFYSRHRYEEKVRLPENSSHSSTVSPFAQPSRGLNISTQSFIFPICHDAELYGRVKEVQAIRRTFMNDLVDPVLMEVMKEECLSAANADDGSTVDTTNGKTNNATGTSANNSKTSGKASNNSNKQSNEIVTTFTTAPGIGKNPEWPDINYILPVHK